MSADLLPCPFCGGPADEERYDRLITIGCKACGYKRGFRGVLSPEPSDVRVSPLEFYHPDADEKAHALWNTRATTSIGDAA